MKALFSDVLKIVYTTRVFETLPMRNVNAIGNIQKQLPEVLCQKRCALKIPPISQENTCVESLKNSLKDRNFPVKFAKFLRIPIFRNICERLLLNINVMQNNDEKALRKMLSQVFSDPYFPVYGLNLRVCPHTGNMGQGKPVLRHILRSDDEIIAPNRSNISA